MKKLITLIGLICAAYSTQAQFTGGQQQGLEDVIVEVYYSSDKFDATDTDGGTLIPRSITYRVYIDMAPGYELQAVYGNADHELKIETSTYFFNNEDRGEETGDAIDAGRLDENTVALDSWVSMGAASDEHWGILKQTDPDLLGVSPQSIIGGANNDGGSEGIPGGLLKNDAKIAGIPLTIADGMFLAGPVPQATVVGLDLSVFNDENDGPGIETNNGSWANLEGVMGPNFRNQVLIAQLTTEGDLSFELNVQLGTPDGGTEQYVAKNPVGDEIFFKDLTFPAPVGPSFLSSKANNEVLAEVKKVEERIALYPNPATGADFITLSLENIAADSEQVQVTVVDVLGKVAMNQAFVVSGSSMVKQLNVVDLPAGTYVVTATTETSVMTERLMIR